MRTQIFVDNEVLSQASAITEFRWLLTHNLKYVDAQNKETWAIWTPAQKSTVMLKFADLVERHADELALWEGKCMGQAISTTKALHGMFIASFRFKFSTEVICNEF